MVSWWNKVGIDRMRKGVYNGEEKRNSIVVQLGGNWRAYIDRHGGFTQRGVISAHRGKGRGRSGMRYPSLPELSSVISFDSGLSRVPKV